MVDRVLVPSEGDGTGVEELSWGQLDRWKAMGRLGTWPPVGASVVRHHGTLTRQVLIRCHPVAVGAGGAVTLSDLAHRAPATPAAG
jgi:hypothetical protein